MEPPKPKTADVFAKLLSFILLPNLLVCYPAVVSGSGRIFRGEKLDWEIYPILLIGVMPLVLSLVYWKMLKTREIFVIGRKQRIIPFLLSFAGTLLTLYFARVNGGNNFWYSLYYFFLFVSLLGFIVTLFWKISLHMLAMSAIASAVVFLVAEKNIANAALAGAAFLIPIILIAWARMHLKSHDWLQIVAGFLVGVISPALFAWMNYSQFLPYPPIGFH
jgi:hypothetical protein